MKNKILILALFSVSLLSCRKYLDINSDPDTPQNPDPTSVFPTLIANIPGGGGERGTGGVQSDALWIGSYIQFWHSRTSDAGTVGQADWDRHGYNSFTADRGAGIWRLTYYGAGKGMEYCINEGIQRGQWDVVGATLAIKAYLFQLTTNYHGDIIYNDAFKEDSVFFRWDDQSVVYRGVDSLARLAIAYLNRTDYGPNAVRLTVKGDISGYNGNVNLWKKFAYGILARNFAAPIWKSTYSADSVIKYADLGPNTIAGTDDFVIPFEASRNQDANWFGTFRNNINELRQSDYIVRLLDGRVFTGATSFATRDPRMRHMLTRSIDTTNGNGGYRGVVPNVSDATTGNARIPTLWGDEVYTNPGSGNFSAPAGKYLFQNKTVEPIMSYSEMQFMKAEAALRKNDRATAYTAYRNGIQGHFNFINRTGLPRGNVSLFSQTAITAAEQSTYLAGPNVKQSAAALTLSDVMQQKFIALWGWGFVETWTDMRKYHYLDPDPTSVTPQRVYSGFNVPSAFFGDNAASPYINAPTPGGGFYGPFAYRVRPRYNSEYVWNIYIPDMGKTTYYHSVPTWFALP